MGRERLLVGELKAVGLGQKASQRCEVEVRPCKAQGGHWGQEGRCGGQRGWQGGGGSQRGWIARVGNGQSEGEDLAVMFRRPASERKLERRPAAPPSPQHSLFMQPEVLSAAEPQLAEAAHQGLGRGGGGGSRDRGLRRGVRLPVEVLQVLCKARQRAVLAVAKRAGVTAAELGLQTLVKGRVMLQGSWRGEEEATGAAHVLEPAVLLAVTPGVNFPENAAKFHSQIILFLTTTTARSVKE